MLVYIITGVILLLYLVAVYFLGGFFQTSQSAWIFRIIFWVLGLAGAGVFLWLYLRQSKRGKGEAPEAPEVVDLMIREAQQRLASSNLGKEAKLKNLPVVVVSGPEASGKTTTVIRSGTEPELLAGQVNQNGQVAPTGAANLWFATKTVFVELGGKLTGDASSWSRLIRKLRPSRWRSMAGKGAQSPRLAVVCIDCERLMQAGGAEGAEQLARDLHQRLSELAERLGIHLPVYVLFTKMDRLPFFIDFARNLSNEEAGRIVGATLPAAIGTRPGVYAEEESRRLTGAFNNTFQTLCDQRLVLLNREHQDRLLPNIFEFPREFSKLRAAAVKFMVELCRPSQLAVGPFLRGFYFSGVRPVVESEGIRSAPREEQAEEEGFGSATRLFRPSPIEQNPEDLSSSEAAGGRKVPQWVFLSHLFTDILLKDRVAMATSEVSTQRSFWRRFAFASLTALALAYLGFATWSYFGNREIEDRVLAAARSTAGVAPSGDTLPSLDTLRHLDTMRETLAEIEGHRVHGRPLGLRWGLYAGGKLYDPLFRAYFERFRTILLNPTLAGLAEDLRGLPSEPSPMYEEGPTYTKLKAYLIPTEIPECSTREFLGPALTERWAQGHEVDEERRRLAHAQFDYYAAVLPVRNPYDLQSDEVGVERGRKYLAQFSGEERMYLSMIEEASSKADPVNFNRDFPGSEAVVLNKKEIAGAFTRAGWPIVEERLNNLAEGARTGCDAKVLGEYARPAGDLPKLQEELRGRYFKEFFQEWLEYLRETRVLRYRSARDAANKLSRTSAPQSPLLAALWVAAVHTSAAPEEVAKNFQPPQYMAPPGGEPGAYVADSNRGYLSDLFQLQEVWSQLAGAPEGSQEQEQLMEQCANTGRAAKTNTNQIALNFRGDSQGQAGSAVRHIILAPIEYSERLLNAMGPDPNKGGKGLCTTISALQKKFPFDPDATVEASLEEVAGVFHPEFGQLWGLYNEFLSDALMQQGYQFVQKPNARLKLNPAFIQFFNHAAQISRAFYPEGAAEARFEYTLTPQPSDTLEQLVLNIDGNRVIWQEGIGAQPQQSSWPGDSSGARLTGLYRGGSVGLLNYPRGLWASFRFFHDADVIPRSGNGVYEWRPKTAGQQMVLDDRPVIVRYHLNHEGKPPIFQKGYLSTLTCVSQVTQ